MAVVSESTRGDYEPAPLAARRRRVQAAVAALAEASASAGERCGEAVVCWTYSLCDPSSV